ncbi:MAG: helix-turn-helix domain-containing protein [Roseburia sp.]|nr:helix-turn-helix domain-containing protein [Roseburia sp.]
MSVPMLDGKTVGSVITEFRKRKDMSQEVLSGLAGIARTHLSAIEHGERKPTLETFYRICCALDTTMETVMREIEIKLARNEKPR